MQSVHVVDILRRLIMPRLEKNAPSIRPHWCRCIIHHLPEFLKRHVLLSFLLSHLIPLIHAGDQLVFHPTQRLEQEPTLSVEALGSAAVAPPFPAGEGAARRGSGNGRVGHGGCRGGA